jgi:hypothetical protein
MKGPKMLVPGEFAILTVADARALVLMLTRLGGGNIQNVYPAIVEVPGAMELLDRCRALLEHLERLDTLEMLHDREYGD